MTDWEKIRQIIAEQFVIEEEEITEETELEKDLGAESIDLYELVVAIETEFGLEPEEDDPIGTVRKAGDFIRLVSGTEREEV